MPVKLSGLRPFLIVLALSLAGVASLGAAQAQASGTVTVSVSGKGDVTGPDDAGTGTGINCSESGGPNSDCSEFYSNECEANPNPPPAQFCFPQTIVLSAADRSGTGYTFDSWIGCDTTSGTGGRDCNLTVSTNKPVTANFRDAQGPSVSGLSPSGGVQRGTITISANASDNSGAVQRVEFRVRGALVASDSTAPYSTTFNTTSVSDGPAVIRATAFDAAGNSSFQESSITIDNTAPTLNVTSGPNGQTFGPGSTQTWTFSASDATSGVASVQCSVVSSGSPASFGACSGGSSSHSVSNLPEGSYTFTVRATDNGGLQTSVARTFSIDATAPETSITGGPADGSSQTESSATFSFAATEGGSSFVCRLYPSGTTPPAFAPCSGGGSHTASGLAPGTYVFEVRATDAAGNTDPSPASRTFTVTTPAGGGGGGGGGGADTTPPDTIIDKGPKRKTTKRRATFSFHATEPGSSFECKLDKAAFKPCTSPTKVKVGYGKHRFKVRATDAAGNTDLSPASYSWKRRRPA